MTSMADPDEPTEKTRDDVPTHPAGPRETEETVDRLEDEVLGGEDRAGRPAGDRDDVEPEPPD